MIKAPKAPFVCLQCRLIRLPQRQRLLHNAATTRLLCTSSRKYNSAASISTDIPIQARPTTAPKPNVDIKHIRQNPSLYEENCLERNYKTQSKYPSRIIELFAQWQASQKDGRSLRERGNALRRQIANPATIQHEDEETESKSGKVTTDGATITDGDIKTMSKDQLIEEARIVKEKLSTIEDDEARYEAQMSELALAIPNLTSPETPRGEEPRVLSFINDHPEPTPSLSDRIWRSHMHIGSELGILDFAGAATTSGWGWYYLVDEGAQLEQALISYALAVVTKQDLGWRQVSPPSIVYSHIGAACGFQPRDQNGEQQVYSLKGQPGKPELCLAGTAEIPLAGMKADSILEEADIPLKYIGVSRCYRAEAGARGVDTKGLYRVHEFTKVEMFAWTPPDVTATTEIFDEMLDLQTEILQGLGLHCRVLEMPTTDLGASAFRKCDIEAFFPSRRDPEREGERDGWGEVTSASVCTDYQARRLATRLKTSGKMAYPWTVNGTALAVPRVLAALLENGWDEADMSVTIPEVLRPWMDGREKIGLKHRRQ
ncbi:seryl-tRNA synthetase [Annulohypoxylon maeteangense]|uniref:seryl-tRNA synthetase n=1 Tax=Annulohypoxylon maeteangense TaxID=1927788 RepID=UPI002008AD6C|nr:seryl-tRNA synthetase [Annulohypoxylon maeteangense]KAI0884506.1 seryl-tRNA synthetase [Annulohypoxylon maeteangense]